MPRIIEEMTPMLLVLWCNLRREVDSEHAVRHWIQLAEDALCHRRLPRTDWTDEHHREVARHEAAHKVGVAHSVDGRHDQLVERQATYSTSHLDSTLCKW